jgi:DNA-binding MarR family transcriptional regulator
MHPVPPPDNKVEGWLRTLGIELLCQWDVLVFLYRHQASLVSAEDIARLLGHPTGEVVAALACLESRGLVGRSRVDQGVRLYQFTAPQTPRDENAVDQLLTLAGTRAVRLLLSRTLRRGTPPNQNNGSASIKSQGGATWAKAI